MTGEECHSNVPMNATSNAIPTTSTKTSSSPKILCLGMSYPNREHCIDQFAIQSSHLALVYNHPCPMQAIELVRRNMLTEMDGRDLARLIALEQLCVDPLSDEKKKNENSNLGKKWNRNQNSYEAYTVSMEEGDVYKPNRHYTGNFNRGSGFVMRMMDHFTKHHNLDQNQNKYEDHDDDAVVIQFRKIILDYFWIPKGSWSMTHWRRSFFAETLPCFIEHNVFCPHAIQSGEAAIYLPFCVRCLSQVFCNIEQLEPHFQISFLTKEMLDEVELWKATQTIDANEMQSWLGKKRNQEDIYCTIESRDCSEAMEEELGVSKQELKMLLSRIHNAAKVRMIKLTVATDTNGVSPRGIVGLKPKSDVKRRKPLEVQEPTSSIERVRRLRKKQVTHLDVLAYWEEENDVIHWQNPETEKLHSIRAAGTLAVMSSPDKKKDIIIAQNKMTDDWDPDELWHLDCIYSIREMVSSEPIMCETPKCVNVACSQWISDCAPDYKTWKCCLKCQKENYGGWPTEDMGNQKFITKDIVYNTIAEKFTSIRGSKSQKWIGPWAAEEVILLTIACKVCKTWTEISKVIGTRSSAAAKAKCEELNLVKENMSSFDRTKKRKPERDSVKVDVQLAASFALPNIFISSDLTSNMTPELGSTSCSSTSPTSSEMYEYGTIATAQS